MREVIRVGFLSLFYLFCLSLEKSIGLPCFSLLLAIVLLNSLHGQQKVVGVVLLGVVLAIFYLLPFAVGIGVIATLFLGSEVEMPFFPKESLKIWLLIALLMGFLATFLKVQFMALHWLYHIALLLFLLFVLQTWIYHEQPRRTLKHL